MKVSLVLEIFSLSYAAELLTVARKMQTDYTFRGQRSCIYISMSQICKSVHIRNSTFLFFFNVVSGLI